MLNGKHKDAGGGFGRRPLSGPVADELRRVSEDLELYELEPDESGRTFVLCQRRADKVFYVCRFDGMRDPDARIVEKARELRWWADRGDLLDEMERANDLLDEANERAGRERTEEMVKYWYDYLVERRHYAVNGTRPATDAAPAAAGA